MLSTVKKTNVWVSRTEKNIMDRILVCEFLLKWTHVWNESSLEMRKSCLQQHQVSKVRRSRRVFKNGNEIRFASAEDDAQRLVRLQKSTVLRAAFTKPNDRFEKILRLARQITQSRVGKASSIDVVFYMTMCNHTSLIVKKKCRCAWKCCTIISGEWFENPTIPSIKKCSVKCFHIWI